MSLGWIGRAHGDVSSPSLRPKFSFPNENHLGAKTKLLPSARLPQSLVRGLAIDVQHSSETEYEIVSFLRFIMLTPNLLTKVETASPLLICDG